MATLQTLRNKAGVLLAGVIGLSLLAFILGDFLNSGSGFLRKKQSEIAEINGKTINYQDFAARVEQGVENYKRSANTTTVDENTYASIRNQVWGAYMNEFIFKGQYDKLGVACSPEELFDMVQGRNIHPQIQQATIFQNDITGGFDRNKVIRFLKNMETDPSGQAKQQWVAYEKELMKDRIYTKYQNMISKGMYVTRKMVDADFIETNRKYDFNFVALRYATTPDSLIKVSEADVKAYYDKNKDKFTQEASRDIAYVVWDIVPSEDDKNVVSKWAYDVKAEFQAATNPQQFIAANAESKFNPYYLATRDVPDQIRSWSTEAKPGDVYGPWQEGLTWKLARVTDVKDLPDSVKASHILIRPVNGTDFDAAQKTADSIKGLIDRGQEFATLARQYGTDGSKDAGGDLGWFPQDRMIPVFSEACFAAKKGDLFTLRTDNGIHLIKMNDVSASSRKVQLAILDRTVTPSDKTYQDVYNIASKFASNYDNGTKFDKGVVAENLNKRIATNLKEGDAAISGLENPRELIRWAFTARKGELSDLKEYGPRFVLAKLTEVREKGTATVDQVRTEIENTVRNEKKADYLANQVNQALQGVNSLEALAPKVNANVQTAANAYFTSYTITGLGMEPLVTAAFTTTPLNTLSKPIKGTTGVYVINVNKVTEPDMAANRNESLTRLQQSYTSRAGYEVFGALEKKAKVVDRRNKFY